MGSGWCFFFFMWQVPHFLPRSSCKVLQMLSRTDNATSAKPRARGRAGRHFISLRLASIKLHTYNLFFVTPPPAAPQNSSTVNKHNKHLESSGSHIPKARWTAFSIAQPLRSFPYTKHKLAWREYQSCESEEVHWSTLYRLDTGIDFANEQANTSTIIYLALHSEQIDGGWIDGCV